MRFLLLSVTFIAAQVLNPCVGEAEFISGDFREELSTEQDGSPPVRLLENLGESVSGAPDLSAADEISNPAGFGGLATIDLNTTGIVTLTGDQEGFGFADYANAEFTISSIVLDAGEFITGVTLLADNLVDLGSPNTSGTYSLSTSFTSDSVTIRYQGDSPSSFFDFGDGFTSTFQVTTAVVPEPSTFALLGIGSIAVIGCARRRKKQAA